MRSKKKNMLNRDKYMSSTTSLKRKEEKSIFYTHATTTMSKYLNY